MNKEFNNTRPTIDLNSSYTNALVVNLNGLKTGYIIVTVDKDGIYGPFKTREEAIQFAEETYLNVNNYYTIARLVGEEEG